MIGMYPRVRQMLWISVIQGTRSRQPGSIGHLLAGMLWPLMIWPAALPGIQVATESLSIEGYTGQVSYQPGEPIGFHLSSQAPQADLVIFRVGAERIQVETRQGIAVHLQPVPPRASSEGCGWPLTLEIPVGENWKSGYYEAVFHVAGGGGQSAQAVIPFVIRPSPRKERRGILLQLSTNTYNAYTPWGGHSLYSFHDRDGLQGHRVSFDRPLQSQFSNWEGPFIRWAESHGYELDYAANSDLEFHPELLNGYCLVLSVGHDEYWSAPMRDTLETFIRNGGNVAFFSGNTCCWQVRSEEGGRALTCWKQAYVLDPLFRNGDPQRLSTLWSHHLVGRPENQMTGVGFLWGGYHRSHGELMDGDGAYQVHRPDHWILAGTDLKSGDKFGGPHTIVGYECDGCEMEWREGLPFPTGRDGTPRDLEIIATAPAKWAPGDSWWYDQFPKDRVGSAVLGVYRNGGTVFTCGSTDWAHGLAGNDPHVVRITRNILDRLSH